MSIFTYKWLFFSGRKMNTIKNVLKVVTKFRFIFPPKILKEL